MKTFISAIAATFFLTGMPPIEADAQEAPELYIYSTEDGGGDLVSDYPFDKAVHLEESICIAGDCLYVAQEPGFVTDDEGQAVPAGRFFVKDALPFRLTLVGVDAGVSLKFGGIVLDTPGQFINLGLSPFHAHTTYQLQIAEGVAGTYAATVRITTQSDRYEDSPDYTLLLSNEEPTTTSSSTSSTSTSSTTSTSTSASTSTSTTWLTTTTLAGGICGDGVLDESEQCDDGNADWNTGELCRADCTALACGDTNDTGAVEATDALILLQGSIGVLTCEPCVCDVDASGGAAPVSASDALRVLRKSVDSGVQLVCPVCP
jgi:hypothetical protein